MLLFNIITLNSNTCVTFIKNLFDARKIEFLLHALQVRLRGLFDLVAIFEPCSCSAGCSKGHWTGIVVTPTLPSSSSEEVVPQWQWDQTGHWVLSHFWTLQTFKGISTVQHYGTMTHLMINANGIQPIIIWQIFTEQRYSAHCLSMTTSKDSVDGLWLNNLLTLFESNFCMLFSSQSHESNLTTWLDTAYYTSVHSVFEI